MGFSRIPGLIPLDAPVVNGTIDLREADLTDNTRALVTDAFEMRRRASSLLRSGVRELFLSSVGGQTCGNLDAFDQ
jgi:hypothetical protein